MRQSSTYKHDVVRVLDNLNRGIDWNALSVRCNEARCFLNNE